MLEFLKSLNNFDKINIDTDAHSIFYQHNFVIEFLEESSIWNANASETLYLISLISSKFLDLRNQSSCHVLVPSNVESDSPSETFFLPLL